MQNRIMFIEYKGNGFTGDAKIAGVTFSKTKKSIHYAGKTFQPVRGGTIKANYIDVASGEPYQISECKENGEDRLDGEKLPIYIDEDIRVEYWTTIRKMPASVNVKVINGKS